MMRARAQVSAVREAGVRSPDAPRSRLITFFRSSGVPVFSLSQIFLMPSPALCACGGRGRGGAHFSARAVGEGETQIFRILKKRRGNWRRAENLGEAIIPPPA